MVREARKAHKHVRESLERSRSYQGRVRGYGEVLVLITMALNLWLEGAAMYQHARGNTQACYEWITLKQGLVCWYPICVRVAKLAMCCPDILHKQVKNFLEDGTVLLATAVFNGQGCMQLWQARALGARGGERAHQHRGGW